MEYKVNLKINKYLWLLFGFIGVIGFLIIWFFTPHKSEIDSIWLVLFKITIFIFIALMVAFFPNRFKFKYLLIIFPFFVFLGFIIPRITYYAYRAIPQGLANAEQEFYTFIWIIVFPAILMSISLAYRLGGGSSSNTIKISLAGVIILFSGYLDFMWYTINPVAIPAVMQYAHHIEMIIGHYPTYVETVIFATFHIPLLVILLILPLDKWENNLLKT